MDKLTVEKSLFILDKIYDLEPAEPPEFVQGDVVLYGAGELGKLALEFLKYVGVKVRFFIDAAALPGNLFNGEIPVYNLNNRPKEIPEQILVSTLSCPFSYIYYTLKELGYKNILPFYDYAWIFRDVHPLNNGWFSGKLSKKDKRGIESVISRLEDEFSRVCYLQFLVWRVFRRDSRHISDYPNIPAMLNNRYFINEIKSVLSTREDFLDIGAYDGRVFRQFLTCVNNQFNSAFLLEPEEENFLLLSNYLDEADRDIRRKSSIFRVAVGKSDKLIKFSSGFGLASKPGNINAKFVERIKLDNLKYNPTFIKLHIEGEELNALKGAKEKISKCRPIVVSTTYHNRDGLWKIPLYMIDNFENYKFYFRLHSYCGCSSVIYAIPDERLNG